MPPADPSSGDSADHTERLWPTPVWWVVGALLVATVWLVLVVSTPTSVMVGGTVAAGGLVLGGLGAAGSVRVGVRAGELVAGRAHVPLSACGAVLPLDEEAARTLRGVGADARAFLLLRPWLPRAIRVDLEDPADPTPYWLVSARDPEAIADAARASRYAPGASGAGDARTAR